MSIDKCQITGREWMFMADQCVLRDVRGAWIDGLFVPASKVAQPHGFGMVNEPVIHCCKVAYDEHSVKSSG